MKKMIIALLMILNILFLVSCSQFENPNPDYCVSGVKEDVYICKKTYTSYFDTTISISLYLTPEDNYKIEDIFAYSESLFEEYHELLDKYNEYDGVVNVYSINHSESTTNTISQKLLDVIQFGLESESLIQIDGVPLFNIALNPVLDIWHNARESEDCDKTTSYSYNICPVPSDLIDGVSFPTNPQNIILDDTLNTITFLEAGMSIDLGGYGKGYVSELLSDYYDSLGIAYLLNVGNSNVKSGGVNPNNDDGLYYIALTKPNIELSFVSNYFAYIKIPQGLSVVTSGNYQRFFVGSEDHLVYHHIIDPRTNYPGGEAMSVTVLYEDGSYADIFSTAIFLMKVSEAITFVNSFDGLEAIWYLENGTVIYSDGFSPYLYELL